MNENNQNQENFYNNQTQINNNPWANGSFNSGSQSYNQQQNPWGQNNQVNNNYKDQYQSTDVNQNMYNQQYQNTDVNQNMYNQQYQNTDVNQNMYNQQYQSTDVNQNMYNQQYQNTEINSNMYNQSNLTNNNYNEQSNLNTLINEMPKVTYPMPNVQTDSNQNMNELFTYTQMTNNQEIKTPPNLVDTHVYANVLNSKNEKVKNNKKKLMIIIITLLILILGMVVFLLIKNLGKGNSKPIPQPQATVTEETPISSDSEEVDNAIDSLARTNSYSFITGINHYVSMSKSLGYDSTKGYDKQVPVATSGNVLCNTADGKTWTGNVATGSETCDNFMKSVINKANISPQEAQIILNSAGNVLDGTWMKFNGLYCLYNGTSIDSACTKNKPE